MKRKKSNVIKKALHKYGVPRKVYLEKFINASRNIQTVTRYGIRIGSKQYWNEKLAICYMGTKVAVDKTENMIEVFELNGKKICSFEK